MGCKHTPSLGIVCTCAPNFQIFFALLTQPLSFDFPAFLTDFFKIFLPSWGQKLLLHCYEGEWKVWVICLGQYYLLFGSYLKALLQFGCHWLQRFPWSIVQLSLHPNLKGLLCLDCCSFLNQEHHLWMTWTYCAVLKVRSGLQSAIGPLFE